MDKNNEWTLKKLKQCNELIENNKRLMKEYPNEKGLHIDMLSLKKSRDDMLQNHFKLSIDVPIKITEEDGVFVGLTCCNVASQGKTVGECIDNTLEALELYLED